MELETEWCVALQRDAVVVEDAFLLLCIYIHTSLQRRPSAAF